MDMPFVPTKNGISNNAGKALPLSEKKPTDGIIFEIAEINFFFMCCSYLRIPKAAERLQRPAIFPSQSQNNNTKSMFLHLKFHFFFKDPWLSFDSDDMLILWAQTSPVLLLSLGGVRPTILCSLGEMWSFSADDFIPLYLTRAHAATSTGQSNRISAHGDILQ